MTDWWQSSPLADPATQEQFATGEAYLKTQPQDIANLIRGLTSYKIDPKTFSIRGRGVAISERARMMQKAMRYDENYDQAAYPARAAAIKEFNAGGPSSPAGQITAGNTAIQHLLTMSDAAEKLKAMPGFMNKIAASGLSFLSYAAAYLNNASLRGTPAGQALADFMTARNHFAEEVTKFYAGATGSEQERERSLSVLDPAKSIQELRSTFKTEGELMHGKINALQDRYKTALGPKAWLTAVEGAGSQFPIVQKKTEGALKEIFARAQPQQATSAPQPDAEGWTTLPNGVRIREMK